MSRLACLYRFIKSGVKVTVTTIRVFPETPGKPDDPGFTITGAPPFTKDEVTGLPPSSTVPGPPVDILPSKPATHTFDFVAKPGAAAPWDTLDDIFLLVAFRLNDGTV